MDYSAQAGSATQGTDFQATAGTLSWNSGDATQRSISVAIVNDTNTESSESFTVLLSNPTGGLVLGSPVSATVTITDDDAAPPPSGGGGGGGTVGIFLVAGLFVAIALRRTRIQS